MTSGFEIIQGFSVDGYTCQVGAMALLGIYRQVVHLSGKSIFAMYGKGRRVAVQLAVIHLNCLSLMTCYIGDRRHLGILTFDSLHRQGYRIIRFQ